MAYVFVFRTNTHTHAHTPLLPPPNEIINKISLCQAADFLQINYVADTKHSHKYTCTTSMVKDRKRVIRCYRQYAVRTTYQCVCSCVRSLFMGSKLSLFCARRLFRVFHSHRRNVTSRVFSKYLEGETNDTDRRRNRRSEREKAKALTMFVIPFPFRQQKKNSEN